MLASLLWAGLAALVGDASAQGLTAEDAARSSLVHDPDYLAAVAAVEAAEGRLRATAVLLADPTLSAELSLVEPRWSASVEQPLSLSGEGRARHAAALAERDAAELDRRHAALVSAAGARAAWVDLAAAEARRPLADEALAQAHARRVAVEARVTAGDAPTLDARLARLAEAQAALAVVEARDAVAEARVALARFVPDAAGATVTGDPGAAVPAPAGGGERADVLAARRRVEAADAALRAARAATVPAVGLGASVEREGDTVYAGPSLAWTLPVWTAGAAPRAEARAEAERARAEGAALDRAAEVDRVTRAAAALRGREARAGLVDDPVGEARAALAAIGAAESAGELDLATATLLRQQALDGAASALDLARAAAHAELRALLAASDPALLPSDLHEVSP